MLDVLKFVSGAVAKKDFVPSLNHFRIERGRISGSNGRITISSPIQLDIDAAPKALPFIKAIETCKKEVAIHLSAAGRLGIRSGPFKAFIDCTEAVVHDMQPEGQLVDLPGDILTSLKIVEPFTAEDASRPWAMGVLLRGQSAYATNNVALIEYWLGFNMPVEVNIPQTTVRELLRIGEEPKRLQVSDKSITFHYEGGRWLTSTLYGCDWPDLNPILSRQNTQQDFPAGFFEALTDLVPFTNDSSHVYLGDGIISTSSAEGQGTSVDLDSRGQILACYDIDQLRLLDGIAKTFDFLAYPGPALFYGDRLRGAVIGIRL